MLEKTINNKKRVILFNKYDLGNRSELKVWNNQSSQLQRVKEYYETKRNTPVLFTSKFEKNSIAQIIPTALATINNAKVP